MNKSRKRYLADCDADPEERIPKSPRGSYVQDGDKRYFNDADDDNEERISNSPRGAFVNDGWSVESGWTAFARYRSTVEDRECHGRKHNWLPDRTFDVVYEILKCTNLPDALVYEVVEYIQASVARIWLDWDLHLAADSLDSRSWDTRDLLAGWEPSGIGGQENGEGPDYWLFPRVRTQKKWPLRVSWDEFRTVCQMPIAPPFVEEIRLFTRCCDFDNINNDQVENEVSIPSTGDFYISASEQQMFYSRVARTYETMVRCDSCDSPVITCGDLLWGVGQVAWVVAQTEHITSPLMVHHMLDKAVYDRDRRVLHVPVRFFTSAQDRPPLSNFDDVEFLRVSRRIVYGTCGVGERSHVASRSQGYEYTYVLYTTVCV